MLVTSVKEREKRSTWKDGGKDTPENQLKTAFIEIDGQPMMMMSRRVSFKPFLPTCFFGYEIKFRNRTRSSPWYF